MIEEMELQNLHFSQTTETKMKGAWNERVKTWIPNVRVIFGPK